MRYSNRKQRATAVVIPAVITAAAAAGAALGYLGLVSGKLSIDLDIGRRYRPLGPQVIDIAAPRTSCST